jgi:hypothetical protein
MSFNFVKTTLSDFFVGEARVRLIFEVLGKILLPFARRVILGS